MKKPAPRGENGNGPNSGKNVVRQKRIARIKGKVEDGTYRVKPKKVADKMVEDAVSKVRSRLDTK